MATHHLIAVNELSCCLFLKTMINVTAYRYVLSPNYGISVNPPEAGANFSHFIICKHFEQIQTLINIEFLIKIDIRVNYDLKSKMRNEMCHALAFDDSLVELRAGFWFALRTHRKDKHKNHYFNERERKKVQLMLKASFIIYMGVSIGVRANNTQHSTTQANGDEKSRFRDFVFTFNAFDKI